MNLSDLKVGQTARITKIKVEDKKIKRHLLDMGMTKGTTVKMKKSTPMKDPMSILVRGYELCIGKAELEKIEVEIVLDKNEKSMNVAKKNEERMDER